MSGIDRLRRLADESRDAAPEWYDPNDLAGVLRSSYGWVGGPSPAADAAYIAAMNPEVGRALLDVVEEAWGHADCYGGGALGDLLLHLDALLDEQEQA